jgi:hypothetical protein
VLMAPLCTIFSVRDYMSIALESMCLGVPVSCVSRQVSFSENRETLEFLTEFFFLSFFFVLAYAMMHDVLLVDVRLCHSASHTLQGNDNDGYSVRGIFEPHFCQSPSNL